MNNNGFVSILKGEFYKITIGKSLLKFVIAYISIFIIFSFIFFLMNNIVSTVMPNIFDEGGESYETIEEAIQDVEAMIEENKKAESEGSFVLRMMNRNGYALKSTLALLKYAKSHNINYSSMQIYGDSDTSLTAYGYINFITQIMIIPIVIYCIVLMGNKLGGEIKNGAMKMQLLRPISRDSIIGAKILSTTIIGFGLVILTYILSTIVGIIGFKADYSDIYMVVNAKTVIKTSAAGLVFFEMFFYLYYVFAYIILAAFFSLLLSNSALAFPILSLLFLDEIETLLGCIGIGYIGFNVNLAWKSAFTVAGPSLNYMNLYSMLSISLIWLSGLMAYIYLRFRKKDIQ